MGGVKRKPISQMDMEKKAEKEKDSKKKTKPAAEKKIRGLSLPDMGDEAVRKELGKMGAITPYSVASRYDLRLGVAKSFLKELERKNIVRPVGGNDRIRIYQAVAA